MVRKYTPKRSRQGRMVRAAALRDAGRSLREIGRELGCHHDTVWRDLKKWDALHPPSNVSDLPVGKTPPGGKNPTPGSDAPASVIPLRRAE